MSQYSREELLTSAIGHGQRAWYMKPADLEELRNAGLFFDGPVPMDTARRIVCWEPVSFELDNLVDPNTMESYEVPERMRTVVAHPHTHRVLNIAGDGYNVDLHIVMEQALQVATDNGLECSSAVCLGDGDFMGMSFKPTDRIVLGDQYGGIEPYISFNSSLTSKMATGYTVGSIRQVCDNTMQAAWGRAHRKMALRRTRNAADMVSASAIREHLDIALAVTAETVELLERWANVTITDDDIKAVFDKWAPLPEEEGRSRTIALNKRGAIRKMLADPRVRDLGQTAAGLWQAHNTWAHWEATAKGHSKHDRIGRRMERTARGDVAKQDHAFMTIVGSVVGDVERALQPA